LIGFENCEGDAAEAPTVGGCEDATWMGAGEGCARVGAPEAVVVVCCTSCSVCDVVGATPSSVVSVYGGGGGSSLSSFCAASHSWYDCPPSSVEPLAEPEAEKPVTEVSE